MGAVWKGPERPESPGTTRLGLLRAGGRDRATRSGALVPWHAGQDHGHAASIRNTGEHQAGPDESGESDPSWMHPVTQHRSQYNQRSGSDSHLSFERHRLPPPIQGKAGGFPRLNTAIDDRHPVESCRAEFLSGLLGAISGSAKQEAGIGVLGEFPDGIGLKILKREEMRPWDMRFLEFGGSADIDEDGGGTMGSDLGRRDFGKRD